MDSVFTPFVPSSVLELDVARSTILTDNMVAELARIGDDPADIVHTMALSTAEIQAFMARCEGLTTGERHEISMLLHAAKSRETHLHKWRNERVLGTGKTVDATRVSLRTPRRALSRKEFMPAFADRMLSMGISRRLAIDIARTIPPTGRRESSRPPGTFGFVSRTPFWTIQDEDLELAKAVVADLTRALATPELARSLGESRVAQIVGIVLDAARVARRTGVALEPLRLSLLVALYIKDGGATIEEATRLIGVLRGDDSSELQTADVAALLQALTAVKDIDGRSLPLVTETTGGRWQVVEHDRMTEASQDGSHPFESPEKELHAFMLGDPGEASQGVNRLNHWAVRLGRDPQSPEARMASLHEMYHGYLNDSSSYGSLLQVVGMLCREQTEESGSSKLLRELVHDSVHVQELYATYASSFLVGRGHPDPALLADYGHDYRSYLEDAFRIARRMPNPVLSFRLVETIVRAAMQADCLAPFIDTLPSQWDLDMIDARELPNARLRALQRPKLLETLIRRLQEWSATQTSADIREVLDTRPHDDAAYDRLIEARLDHATDTIGGFLYDCCRDLLRESGLSCLDFNGHQAFTAPLLATAENVLPESRRGRALVAAPEGSRLEDLLGGWADERLELNPHAPEGTWFWLDETPAERWTELLVGPTPHAMLVVRPLDRVRQQYAFEGPAIQPSDKLGAIVAIRRRVVEPGRPPVIEHALVRSPEQLTLVLSQLETSGKVFASYSLSVLASSGWSDVWWPALRRVGFATVLVDTSPFNQLRAWAQHAEFETSYATITMKGEDRDHVVFTLYPHIDEGLTFLAPCSTIISSALKVEMQELNARGGRFKEDTSVVTRDLDDLSLTISHILHDEPWFDFRADKGDLGEPER